MRSNQLKIVILSGAALLASSNSHASKARLQALQFADFWKDTQTIFIYPQYAGDLGQYATLELGPTGTYSTGLTANTPLGVRAEGGFARKFGSGNAGLYLGHSGTTPNSTYAAASLLEQQNPFYLYYGAGNIGYGLNFSFADLKSTSSKEYSLGGSFGIKVDDIQIGSNLMVYSKSENATSNAKILPALDVAANHQAGRIKHYATGLLARTDVSGATSTSYGLNVGAQDHALKIADKGTFFYGAQVGYAKAGTTKSLNLPVYAGFESDIVTWAALRGAISQALIGYVDTGVKDINTNSTRVSLGGTLKTAGFELDGLLAAATTGQLNGTSFLTSSSLTYHF